MEAVFRQVVKAQRCLEKGRRVGWGMWDVRGGFGNSRLEVVEHRIQQTNTEIWQRWGGYIKNFFRPRSFEVEWDGKVRDSSRTNIGVPEGSPLSPLIFLIYMATILDEIEQRLTQETAWRGKTLDVECPSFVDDIMASLMDWEGTRDLNLTVEKAKKIVEKVASKWNLPLETSKTESLVLKTKRKRGGICYVK